MISARTNAALAAAKRRGVKLGGDRGARLTAKARAAGRAALQERVRNRASCRVGVPQERHSSEPRSSRLFSRRHDSRATGGRL
jgi:hypothetical protein